MSEAVRRPVQGRDKPVQAAEAESASITAPWQPRTDGKQALLVSPRAAVFDHKLPPPEAVDPLAVVTDPIWDNRRGTVWTPDLVHCRLLNVGDTIARLPSPMRRGFVSLLGDAALGDDRPIKRPPSAAEISIADWTWSQLLKRPATQRMLLQAMAFGASAQTVAAMLQRGTGMAVSRPTVSRWYVSERRQLATVWIAERQLVDGPSFERWRGLFESAGIYREKVEQV